MSYKLVDAILKADLPCITATDKLVLCAWASWAKNDGTSIFPTKESVAKRSGCSVRTVHRSTTNLQLANLMSDTDRKHSWGRGHYTPEYTINAKLIEASEYVSPDDYLTDGQSDTLSDSPEQSAIQSEQSAIQSKAVCHLVQAGCQDGMQISHLISQPNPSANLSAEAVSSLSVKAREQEKNKKSDVCFHYHLSEDGNSCLDCGLIRGSRPKTKTKPEPEPVFDNPFDLLAAKRAAEESTL